MTHIMDLVQEAKSAAARLAQHENDRQLVESLPAILEKERLQALYDESTRELTQTMMQIKQELSALNVAGWRRRFYEEMTPSTMQEHGRLFTRIQEAIWQSGNHLWHVTQNKMFIENRLKAGGKPGPFDRVGIDSSVTGAVFVRQWSGLVSQIDLDCFPVGKFDSFERWFCQQFWRTSPVYRSWSGGSGDVYSGSMLFVTLNRR